MFYTINNFRQNIIIQLFIFFSLCILFFTITLALPALATEKSSPELKVEFDQAFEIMMQDPANVDKTLNYAELAIKIKDYEAAIPPLERILMSDPGLTSLKLKLGILYMKLKSYEMASAYFYEVIGSKNASAKLVTKAREYLQQMNKLKQQ